MCLLNGCIIRYTVHMTVTCLTSSQNTLGGVMQAAWLGSKNPRQVKGAELRIFGLRYQLIIRWTQYPRYYNGDQPELPLL